MEPKYTKKRFREIVAVSIKHGLKNGIGDPKELRLALEELGPTFIKIGQIMSTRPDIFPQEYIEELQKLQDNVKPEDDGVIMKVIEEELGNPIESIFPYFEKKPIASASLAEVHMAELKTGEKVVIKVQRPNVREKMKADIAILKKLAPFINFTSLGNGMDAKEVINELANATERELDFLSELENIKKFKENNKDVKFIVCPQAYREYSTSKVLVMDYISGIKIDNLKALKNNNYDLKDIATKLTYNYFKQVFEDGFFHADPHPGNILIHDNKIGYIDFGLMGTLDAGLKRKFNEFLQGVANRDTGMMTKAVLKIGQKRGTINTKLLYSDIDEMYNQYIEESFFDMDIIQIMDEVIKICKKNNIYMPKDITLLLKGLMTIQGVIAMLDSELNIMDIALPYVKGNILEEKFKNFNIMETLEALYTSISANVKISAKLLDLTNHILSGKLKMQLELKNIDNNFTELNKMINRLVFAIIVAALVVGSSLVINANVGFKLYGISVLGLAGYVGAAIAGFWLLISIIKSGRL